MTNSPEITVLTIVYNGQQHISQAVESILNQTFEDFEYIIVDNNSTDNTPEILSSYAGEDLRIKVIKEAEQGVLYARNAGLKIANGDWVTILDSDDVALPDRLQKQLDFVKDNSGVVLLGSGCNMIDDNGVFLKRYSYPAEYDSLVDCLENQDAFFPHSSAFYNRQIASELGDYRFPHAEDYDLWLRLSERGKIASIEEPLIELRRTVMSRSYNIKQEPYILFKLVILLCHLRRKRGLSDPFCSKERWDDFLSWVEEKMKRLKCFKKGIAERHLHRIWYSNQETKVTGLLKILVFCLKNPYAISVLYNKKYLLEAAKKIAVQSESYLK